MPPRLQSSQGTHLPAATFANLLLTSARGPQDTQLITRIHTAVLDFLWYLLPVLITLTFSGFCSICSVLCQRELSFFTPHYLYGICTIVTNSGLNLIFAKQQGLSSMIFFFQEWLISWPSIIKMAFTTSMANVTEIKLAGLIILRDSIKASDCLSFIQS
jgi:hypothetical protein